jgi:hypothetical protein
MKFTRKDKFYVALKIVGLILCMPFIAAYYYLQDL